VTVENPASGYEAADDVAAQLREIVGAEHVRQGAPGDAVASIVPRLVVTPGTDYDFAAVLACADAAGLAVIPRGGGTKLGWANPPARADIVLSLARLNRILEHAWADLTVTVEAGCTVAALQAALAEHGQRLAVDALWPDRATVGGILATNDSGALRLRYGGLRDLAIGVTLALADGTLASSGGKVVKNVAGYDLPKLATGSLGTLGVITQATFRLHPLPLHSRTLTLHAADPNRAQQLMLAIQDSQLAHIALQARLTAGEDAEIDVLFEGTPAGLAAQEGALRKLARNVQVSSGAPGVWDARQELWSRDTSADVDAAHAKLSVLPADLAGTIGIIAEAAATFSVGWSAVLQATGLGLVRLDGVPPSIHATLRELRSGVERRGGSLVVLRQPAGEAQMEAWGNPGDALPLMRALKQQLDPHGTLNPGRFVGGV
jgi:glycolate oxidase FAD binding subunit